MDVRFLGVCLRRFLDLLRLLRGCFCPLGSRVFVRVGMLHFRFPARLHFLRRTRRWIFAVVLLLLDDFLVVSYISWV